METIQNEWSLPIVMTWALVVPTVLLVVSPLLDGLGRQIRARIHSRVGPPITQGWLDLAKLSGKEDVTTTDNPLVRGMPFLALASVIVAGMLLPVGGLAPFSFAGDMLVFLYLLGFSTVALVLGGAASGNPYAFAGGNREMLMLLFAEPVLAFALFVLAMKADTFRLTELVSWHTVNGYTLSTALAGVGALLALLAYLGKLPFDLAEAEQELMGGVLIEQGGWRLALYRWTFFVKWWIVAWLIAEVFIPTPVPLYLGVPVMLIKTLGLFVLVTISETLLARLRIDQAKVYFTYVAFFVMFAITFALIGA